MIKPPVLALSIYGNYPVYFWEDRPEVHFKRVSNFKNAGLGSELTLKLKKYRMSAGLQLFTQRYAENNTLNNLPSWAVANTYYNSKVGNRYILLGLNLIHYKKIELDYYTGLVQSRMKNTRYIATARDGSRIDSTYNGSVLGKSGSMRQQLNLNVSVMQRKCNIFIAVYSDVVFIPFKEAEELNPNVKLARITLGAALGVKYTFNYD
ncbi:MAG: hypothetical protein JNL57_00330 [Bacteroidetes bacterium]|nr:hypothetical protein [Bacteroidota bacterium]